MWGGVAIFVVFAPSWCFSKETGYIAANHPTSIKQAKRSLHQDLWCKYFHPKSYKKVPPYCNWKSISSLWWENKIGTHLSRSVLSIWLCSFSHLSAMQDLWIISFFYFFPFHIIMLEKRWIPIFENKFRLAWLEELKNP